MKINGIDIAEYGAEQWNLEPGYSTAANTSEWQSGMLSPILVPSSLGMKKMKVSVIVRGRDRAQIWERSRELVSILTKPSVVEFDGFHSLFNCVLTDVKQVESSLNRFHKTVLELTGIECSTSYTSNTFTVRSGGEYRGSISNHGDLDTPAIIRIRRSSAFDLSMEGLFGNKFSIGDNFLEIKEETITGGTILIINGESGKVIIGSGDEGNSTDAFGKINKMTEFPNLKKGENEFYINNRSRAELNLTIMHRDRYL